MKKTLTTIIAATALVLTNGIGANGAVPEGRDTSNFRKWVNTLVDDEISEQLARYGRTFAKAFATAGRGHGSFCNCLIVRYYFNKRVETQAFFGHVSTPCFITH